MYEPNPPNDDTATNVTPPTDSGSSDSAGQSDHARARAYGSTDPDTDPRKLALARECYDMWCKPMPYHTIAKKIGIDRKTVMHYVKAEAERRQAEFAGEREARIQQSIRTAERVRDRGIMHLTNGEGDVIRDAAAAKMIIAAQEVIDKRVGLDLPNGVASLESTKSLLQSLDPIALRDIFAAAAARRADKLLADQAPKT